MARGGCAAPPEVRIDARRLSFARTLCAAGAFVERKEDGGSLADARLQRNGRSGRRPAYSLPSTAGLLLHRPPVCSSSRSLARCSSVSTLTTAEYVSRCNFFNWAAGFSTFAAESAWIFWNCSCCSGLTPSFSPTLVQNAAPAAESRRGPNSFLTISQRRACCLSVRSV